MTSPWGTKRLQACNRDLTDLSNDDLDNVLRQRCKVLGDQAFATGPYEPESTFALTSLGPAYERGGLLVRVYLSITWWLLPVQYN